MIYSCVVLVNGGWSSWLNWNSCTVTCGGGISTKSRHCINPAPSGGGTRCVGDSVESRVCESNSCPGNQI
jgi:thrombospondin motif-containing protein 14